MDLFFGASKEAASKKAPQPTVNIRVEERIVGKRDARALSTGKKPKGSSVAHREDETKRRRRRPHNSSHEETVQKKRRSYERGTSAVARAVASSRDREIVNRNRERVGSLPTSPRLENSPDRVKTASDTRKHDRAQRVQKKRKEPVDEKEEPALAPAAEIERCASVPAHPGGAHHSSAMLSAMPSPTMDHDDGSNAVVSSADAVKQSETHYEDYFEWSDAGERLKTIELLLPAPGSSEMFSLLMPRSFDREATEPRDEYLPVNDLLATVRVVARYLVDSPEFQTRVCDDKENGIMRQLERARNRRNGGDLVRAIDSFNAMLKDERVAGRAGPCFDSASIPSDLAIHIIEQIYNRVVAPTVALLRQYKAFSNNVYGEILPTLVNQIIDEARITSDCVFLDLGCGIGNVVLQVAAQTGCQASGIEIMKVPARFAQRQAREFERRMRQYRLDHGSVQVWRGDFCESVEVQRLLPKADVLLVNNYAFDGPLNQILLQMFLDLKEGARIVSLKPFVTPDHKINARNIYSPESILTVKRHAYWSQCVSWTDNGGEYFVQTVDRSRMREFLTSHGMA
ncbi:Nucleosomal histone H3-Lys79 methylase [Coemansia sp. RSA 1813]|nr:Nucleosomal histone H3-Lys79 methylase [Coemansia sp. RSA 1646]KAJ1772647.1 Nucleosomal histone H3-Lys79 methylase [Coemansia sp. RSA 1843]KAJ2090211.1 Nucleosomal histone H3-Lys79 methylase [Coemansia sp. RSA 986]KAJ2214617.1 Nucleosomal histone H3-Lys79 methylase [Coemansia sp. RSA 487]KAJ2570722.1 Nucleosomal histone H3-Lys79 methylase [Coemansia sp. RSA 1813]